MSAQAAPLRTTKTISLGTSFQPGHVAYSAGQFWVPNAVVNQPGEIAPVDAQSGAVGMAVDLSGQDPILVEASSTADEIFVVGSESSSPNTSAYYVDAINTDTHKVISSTRLDGAPLGQLAVSGGIAFVTNESSNGARDEITSINAGGHVVATFDQSSSFNTQLAPGPLGGVWAAQGGVVTAFTSDGQEGNSTSLPTGFSNPNLVSESTDPSAPFVTATNGAGASVLFRLNHATNHFESEGDLAGQPSAIAADGDNVYYTTNDSKGDATLHSTASTEGTAVGAYSQGIAIDGNEVAVANGALPGQTSDLTMVN